MSECSGIVGFHLELAGVSVEVGDKRKEKLSVRLTWTGSNPPQFGGKKSWNLARQRDWWALKASEAQRHTCAIWTGKFWKWLLHRYAEVDGEARETDGFWERNSTNVEGLPHLDCTVCKHRSSSSRNKIIVALIDRSIFRKGTLASNWILLHNSSINIKW